MIPRLCLPLLALLLMGAAAHMPSGPRILPPEQAAREGQALVAEMLSQRPDKDTTNSATLRVRRNRLRIEIPVTIEIRVTSTNWQTIYTATASARGTPVPARGNVPASLAPGETLIITRSENRTNAYEHTVRGDAASPATSRPTGAALMTPFAGSDFWLADLGLEFLHWPEQKVLRREMKRSRDCHVLESINPQPATGYARVVSWIDAESGGILNAEAFDARGKKVKTYISKGFTKVRGEWMLGEMQVDDDITGSRTTIEFDYDRS